MEILVRKCKKRARIKKSKLEKWLDEHEIVIIGKKSELSKKPMSNVIIRDENIVFAFHYLFKGIKKYYISGSIISGSIQKKNKKWWVLQVPMSTKEIAERFRNTIEYK